MDLSELQVPFSDFDCFLSICSLNRRLIIADLLKSGPSDCYLNPLKQSSVPFLQSYLWFQASHAVFMVKLKDLSSTFKVMLKFLQQLFAGIKGNPPGINILMMNSSSFDHYYINCIV